MGGGATLRAPIFCCFSAKYDGKRIGAVLSKWRLTDGAETCHAIAVGQMPGGSFPRRSNAGRPSKIVGLYTKRE